MSVNRAGQRQATVIPQQQAPKPEAAAKNESTAQRAVKAADSFVNVSEAGAEAAQYLGKKAADRAKAKALEKIPERDLKPRRTKKAEARRKARLQKARAKANKIRAASTGAKVSKLANAASKGLGVVGTGLAAANQYMESSAQTTAGKVVDAGGAAAMDIALGVVSSKTALLDGLLNAVLPDSIIKKSGGLISGNLSTSVRSIVTVGESLITGDTRGLDDFHTRSKRGEFGVVFQAASEAGDYWAEKGVAGGLKEFGKEAWRAFKSLF